jgi:putative polyhydroxyalkanoate system protein
MADIDITQHHFMPLDNARAAAQKVADQMVAEFDMTAEWQGDVLSFKRSGVSGTLAVRESEAQLEITLGGMLKAFAPQIREKVTRNMAKVFSGVVIA